MEVRTRSKGKLKLGSAQIPLDGTTKTYVGTKIGKKSYKDVKYKNSIIPDPVITIAESHVNQRNNPRRSARLKGRSTTSSSI